MPLRSSVIILSKVFNPYKALNTHRPCFCFYPWRQLRSVTIKLIQWMWGCRIFYTENGNSRFLWNVGTIYQTIRHYNSTRPRS